MRGAKSALVLDCDGVLWGGIVSEDGPNGVLLGERGKGEAYARFQALLKQLSRHGVLLAICSKNDEADVRAVFDTKPEMVLQSSRYRCLGPSVGSRNRSR